MLGNSQKGSNASTSTATTNVDKSIQLGGNGYVLALQDNQLASGASVNITTADPEVVKSALVTTSALAQRTAESADKVAASQASFVEAALGSKNAMYLILGVAAIGGLAWLLAAIFGGRKAA